MSYNASILSLSTAFCPLIGGFLAGIAWYYPFVLPLLAIPVGLFVIFNLEEPNLEKISDFSLYVKAIFKSILRKEVITVFILSILTFIILYGAILTYIPFLLNQKFNLTASQIGIFLSLSSFSTAVVASQIGRFIAKFGSLALLKTAFVLYFFTTFLIPNINNLYLLIIPIVIFGTAQALNIPSLQTVLANLAPDGQLCFFISFNGMVLRIGQFLRLFVIGIGNVFNQFKGAYYLASGIALTGILLMFIFLNNKIINHVK